MLPLIIGALVLVAAGTAVYLTFRDHKPQPSNDEYAHALEHWIEGNLDEATAILHKLVHDQPDSLEPFYQLGNLLRIQGDAERAAVLHRGLTVRANLTTTQKFWIGLSLARDLNALGRWEASRDVLDSLPKIATNRSQYWKTRFEQWHGLGDITEAARTLRNASKQGPEKDRPWFLSSFASYQLDRALTHALVGENGEANSLLKDVRNIAGTASRSALVRDVFLPLLQEVLLQSGQFARSLPILERACQAENAPPSLWIDLAMLYEKLGHRDKALRMLDGKSGRRNFTPNAAAPYLKMLVNDVPDSDFSKVWSKLSMPMGPDGWVCGDCGHRDERVRWFCPSCRGFQTFSPGRTGGEES
jgi:lipopolysaccharide biosynthesis regulator YciM